MADIFQEKSVPAAAKASEGIDSSGPKDNSAGGGDRQKESSSGGSTLRPVYGERRPVMYHLFETEMKSISAFNTQALQYFSFGAFFLSLFLNISLTAFFSSAPLTDAQLLVVRWGLTATGVLGAISFIFGGCMVYTKNNLIKQIKRETISDLKIHSS